MNVFIASLLMLVVISSTGCAKKLDPAELELQRAINDAEIAAIKNGQAVVRLPGNNNNVTEFHLKDGTRCVKTYEGGVDCEWGSKPAF